MIKQKNSKDYLLQFATSQELTNSINYAFRNFITSEKFCELHKKDREKLMFHWQLMQDFLNDVPEENETVSFSKN